MLVSVRLHSREHGADEATDVRRVFVMRQRADGVR
jgi:hypothetical protein